MEYYSNEDLEKRINELNSQNANLLIKFVELTEENKELKNKINYLEALLDENQVKY